MTQLGELLHELRVGCDPKPFSSVDVGLGYEHTGDHEADAARLLDAIRSALNDSAALPEERG